jgi:tetratricopeptide (TPR) repeat protein
MSEQQPPISWEEKLKQLRREKLQSLICDPQISRAVEQGRPRDLYRLLLAKRKTAGIVERPLIDELLNNRRLFAEPIKQPPTMFTFNGVGTSLYGKQEPDPTDLTHIGTLFITLLFLPVFPLAQYLVSPADASSWYFHAKVPLNRKMRLWRQATLGCAVALVCLVAGMVYYSQAYSTVYVVNALDVPVRVQLDKAAPVTVFPYKPQPFQSVSAGRHRILTRTAAGETVEEFDADVPAVKDVITYNVLGAAPLFAEGIAYYADGKEPAKPDQPAMQHYCGVRFIVRDRVQYVFEMPPQSISLSSGARKETRWRFALDTGGWAKTAKVLYSEEKPKEATDLVARIARLEPDNEEAVSYATEYVKAARGVGAAMEFDRELLKRAPQSAPAHRMLQTYMTQTGRAAESREIYRKLHAEHPDSPLYGYLHARAEIPDEAARLYASLVERSPNHPDLRRGYAYALFQTRRFAEAVPQLERFAVLDPGHKVALLDVHARALIATGRTADAVRLVAATCEQQTRQGNLEEFVVLLYARVAALAPETREVRPPEFYLSELIGADVPTPETRLWYLSQTAPSKIDDQLLAGTTNTTLRALATIARDTGVNTDNALKLAAARSPNDLSWLTTPTLVLLAGAAVRGGDRALAKTLLDSVDTRGSIAALKDHVLDGKDSPELADLDLEVQAALSLLRGDKQRALSDDILQGIVTRAARR